MSRSRKKNPMFTDHGRYTSEMKRFANKAVRNMSNEFFEENPNVGSFKKCFESWNISDYSFGYEGTSFEELVRILEKDDLDWQNWTLMVFGKAESYYDEFKWKGRYNVKTPREDAIRYFRK